MARQMTVKPTAQNGWGEELGWRGLLEFLQKLEHLLHLARGLGMELWALPND